MDVEADSSSVDEVWGLVSVLADDVADANWVVEETMQVAEEGAVDTGWVSGPLWVMVPHEGAFGRSPLRSGDCVALDAISYAPLVCTVTVTETVTATVTS